MNLQVATGPSSPGPSPPPTPSSPPCPRPEPRPAAHRGQPGEGELRDGSMGERGSSHRQQVDYCGCPFPCCLPVQGVPSLLRVCICAPLSPLPSLETATASATAPPPPFPTGTPRAWHTLKIHDAEKADSGNTRYGKYREFRGGAGSGLEMGGGCLPGSAVSRRLSALDADVASFRRAGKVVCIGIPGIQCSAVPVQYRTAQQSTEYRGQYRAVLHSTALYQPVQCNAVMCSLVQYSAVQ